MSASRPFYPKGGEFLSPMQVNNTQEWSPQVYPSKVSGHSRKNGNWTNATTKFDYKIKDKSAVSSFQPKPEIRPQESIVMKSPAPSNQANLVPRKKYEMCKNFREKGVCKYGDRCLFAHGDHELTRRGSPEQDEVKKPEIDLGPPKESEETTLDSTKLLESSANDESLLTQAEQLKGKKHSNSSGTDGASIEVIIDEVHD